MTTDAEVLKHSLQSANEVTDGPTFKMRHDPRITRVGRWIRRASIDELPQLWNVFVGDMTLVGPRPPVPEEVEQYSEYEWRRLSVVPGITCFWQVSGRSELPFQEQVRLDIEYIEQRDLITDIRILLLTVPAVLSGKGAY
jgi:lipopolysaccharide/colanic/teichoic acid biosynthesis glycosyltransferase